MLSKIKFYFDHKVFQLLLNLFQIFQSNLGTDTVLLNVSTDVIALNSNTLIVRHIYVFTLSQFNYIYVALFKKHQPTTVFSR